MIRATLFIIGLAMMGSEGAWFPWINFAGLVPSAAFIWLVTK